MSYNMDTIISTLNTIISTFLLGTIIYVIFISFYLFNFEFPLK